MGQETYELARDILLRLLRFESLSSSESGAIEYIADLLDSWGFDFKLQSIGSGSYNIIVNNNRTPLLSIATHIDTVRIYSLPKSDEKYVYGTGSADAKGSIVAMLLALKNTPLPEQVSLAIFSDEEKGGSGSGSYLSEYHPKYGLILEPTELKLCNRGYGSIEGYIIISLRNYHPSIVGFDEKNTIYHAFSILSLINEKLEKRRIRFTPYFISCGDESEYATPAQCRINFDMGIPPGVSIDEILTLLNELSLQKKFEYMIREYSKPFVASSKELSILLETAYTKTFGNIKWGVMPSWTDANNFSLFGIQSMVFGPGSLVFAHSNVEKILIDEIILASKFLSNIFMLLKKSKKTTPYTHLI